MITVDRVEKGTLTVETMVMQMVYGRDGAKGMREKQGLPQRRIQVRLDRGAVFPSCLTCEVDYY